MGKKGVLLDNGKSASSSMALYWKQARQKKPKEKVEKPVDEEKQLDERAVNSFEKWKLHKEKLINKVHEKKEKLNPADNQKKMRQEQEQEELDRQLLQRQMQKKKPIAIPGFKNASQIKKHFEYQHIEQVDQSKNTLQLPAGQQGLTQDDILHILRQKKAKREMEKKDNLKRQKNLEKEKNLPQDFTALFGDIRKQEEIELLKKAKAAKEAEFAREKVEMERIELQKKMQGQQIDGAAFFKSQILQRLDKGEKNIFAQKDKIQQKEMKVDPSEQDFKPKFIPRILLKK